MHFRLVLFSSLAFLLASCSEESDLLSPDPLHPNQETFISNVFVQIKNQEGVGISHVEIRLGSFIGYTDPQGFILLDHVTTSTSNYLVAAKDGYFNASRRFHAEAGQTQNVIIVMESNQRDAFFSSNTERTFVFDDTFTLHFPADAYEYSDGASYDGVVMVATYTISGDDPLLSFKMPGDLMGINSSGTSGLLASMGMIAVELHASTGELLRLKKDAKVDMHINIPQSMIAHAPPSMPMWYFKEEDGIWEEEGEAVRVGNTYTTQVSHFSFWNCDAWFPILSWKGVFTYTDGTPVPNARVCITIESLQATKCAYTNQGGFVYGSIPAGEPLRVFLSDDCGAEYFTSNLGPVTTPDLLSHFSLEPQNLPRVQIDGIAVNCSGEPVTIGYVTVRSGGEAHYLYLDSTAGYFSTSIMDCTQKDISVKVENIEDLQFSDVVFLPYAESIHADTIKACHDVGSYAVLQVEGVGDPILIEPLFAGTAEGIKTYIYSPDSSLNRMYCEVNGITTGYYPNTSVFLIVSLGIEAHGYCEQANVNITSMDPVGAYIQGTIDGMMSNGSNGGGPLLSFEGTFTALRTQ